MNYELVTQKMKVAYNVIRKRPILVIFDVTKLCNERCPMCNIWKTTSNDMSLEKIKIKAHNLSQFGVGYVFLQGGDPLMRRDIIDIVDIFIEEGIRPTIITNGILLKPELAEEIAKRPCNLAISIDSMIADRYKRLRGVDALGKVKNNIEKIRHLKNNHKGNWSITTTVTKVTELSDVIEIMNYAYDNGFMYAIRPYITVSGTAGRVDEALKYEHQDVLDIFYYIYERSVKENYLASLIYEEHINYIKGHSMPECDAMNYSFLMKETGNISPCIEFPNLQLNLKNFKEYKKEYKKQLDRCNCNTPCFYNDAREIGFLWRKKWRVVKNMPKILYQMRKYGNFF